MSVTIDGIIYRNISGNNVSVTGFTNDIPTTISIASNVTINNISYNVTSIGNNAFNNLLKLTSLTIPNSVTSIDDGAFANCRSLTSVTIPNSVTRIGHGAFNYCYALTSLTIPNSVTSIGYGAFINCRSLTTVTIENHANIIISTNSFTNVSLNLSSNITFFNANNINNLSAVWQTISNYYAIKIYSPLIVPTLLNFSIPTKTYGDSSFTITDPSSNSAGSFSYTSSNLSVATISENTIIINGVGSSTITATQAARSNYTSGTITTIFQVNQSSPTNPIIINNSMSYYIL